MDHVSCCKEWRQDEEDDDDENVYFYVKKGSDSSSFSSVIFFSKFGPDVTSFFLSWSWTEWMDGNQGIVEEKKEQQIRQNITS